MVIRMLTDSLNDDNEFPLFQFKTLKTQNKIAPNLGDRKITRSRLATSPSSMFPLS